MWNHSHQFPDSSVKVNVSLQLSCPGMFDVTDPTLLLRQADSLLNPPPCVSGWLDHTPLLFNEVCFGSTWLSPLSASLHDPDRLRSQLNFAGQLHNK